MCRAAVERKEEEEKALLSLVEVSLSICTSPPSELRSVNST